MNIFCKLFGHKTSTRNADTEYSNVTLLHGEDFHGRVHGLVYGYCARCGKQFHLTSIIVPNIKG